MQIYSTIFPVTDMLTQDTLIRLVIEWNQGSPYNKLSNLNWDGKSRNIKFEEENLSLEIQEIRAYNTIAIRFHQFDENNIIWNTDVVVNFDKHIFSIKLDRETTTETTGFIPKFKTPYLVNKLLDGGYVGKDNGMQISEQVIPVTRNNYHIIEDVICKQAVYNMPIVYVTKSWGKYPFEIQNLAYKLRGVAHVLGEEEADVSSILKTSCNGMNSHHGSVGIYYPGKTNVHKIITTSKYVDKGDILIDRIVRIVCRYVNQQARDTMKEFKMNFLDYNMKKLQKRESKRKVKCPKFMILFLLNCAIKSVPLKNSILVLWRCKLKIKDLEQNMIRVRKRRCYIMVKKMSYLRGKLKNTF